MTNPRLFLIGYRGTGKSTVGRLVAAALDWDFADADTALEQATGRTVAELYATEGEAGFRDRESAVLAEYARHTRLVLATGGGVVLRPANRAMLRSSGYVAWLTAPPEAIWHRLQADPTTATRRPALTTGGFDEVVTLLAVREPLYREVADGVFPTEDRSPEQVAAAILAEYRTTRAPA
jgi:shikimate kinase